MSIRDSMECMAVESTYAQANATQAIGSLQAAGTDSKRRRAAMQAVGYGIGAAVLYAVLFNNADAIMDMTKQGKMMAVVPLALAFLFSYVHGNFTGAFWTALGINASRKATQAGKTADIKPTVRKDTRPRAQLRA